MKTFQEKRNVETKHVGKMSACKPSSAAPSLHLSSLPGLGSDPVAVDRVPTCVPLHAPFPLEESVFWDPTPLQRQSPRQLAFLVIKMAVL